ncbi:MAG: DUF1565 domain-containing protein [Candidatus Cloacimonetes bacterium]|nr:DUF1565 domain-containing protein [Candidatus Cloacimonadota bacterium]
MRNLMIFVFCIPFIGLGAETIYIPEDYATIQEGINESVSGDIILVSPGTYQENIIFYGKEIIVASLFYTTQDTIYISETILDGNQTGRVVTFDHGETVNTILIGFTITNGLASSDDWFDNFGAGIFCYNASSPTLINLKVMNNAASNRGGGIYCSHYSNPIIEDVIIRDNTAFDGGGLYIWNNSAPIIRNVKILHNTAISKGGGIHCMSTCAPVLCNVLIADNYADEGAGGIYCYSHSDMTLNRVTISNNSTSENGGGILCELSSSMIMVNCLMWNDYPQELYFHESRPRVTVTVAYSDIEGGFDGVVTNNNGTLNWLTGNQAENPSFHEAGNGDYSLDIESSCINTGVAYFEYDGEIISNLNGNHYSGIAPDLGNYEYEGEELYARFTANERQGCAPLEVQLTDLSTGEATEWFWDFNNDGVTDSFVQNPIAIYDEMSVYSIRLEVYNDITGETSITLKEDYIYIEAPRVLNQTTGVWYNTIQNGINDSEIFDVLIVQPGTYEENVIFGGKEITVGSLFLTTQDTSYISQTVLSGNGNGNVVTFANNESNAALLTGFTITQGSSIRGGGIYCLNASPTLSDLVITGNEAASGGGICCYDFASPVINNVSIINNTATFRGGGIHLEDHSFPEITNAYIRNNYSGRDGGGLFCYFTSESEIAESIILNNVAEEDGGGIYLYNSESDLSDLVIEGNLAGNKGGGIFCSDRSEPFLENVTIKYNTAEYGGGIYCEEDSDLSFCTENRCSIYQNYVSYRNQGGDLYSEVFLETCLDTFTVAFPTEIQAYPAENFDFDILHGFLGQVDADLYVSPEGDNNNSGLLPSEPLKNIYFASSIIQAESTSHTIYLADGTYSPSSNGERFPVLLPFNVNIAGINQNSVIIDAEGTAGVFDFEDTDTVNISNLEITGGAAENGGGLAFYDSSGNLQNLIITENNAECGGGIYCEYSTINLENVTIRNNTATEIGGGFVQTNGSCLTFDLENRCNIYLNNVLNQGIGSDIYSVSTCNVIVDTFTVMNPTEFYAIHLEQLTFDILNSIYDQVNYDLYVSPSGDNNNNGSSFDEPLKTIQHANSILIVSEMEPHTIFLDTGIYSPSTNGEFFPVNSLNNVSIIGIDEGTVILDAESSARVMSLTGGENVTVANITVTGGNADYGGGIYLNNSALTLQNVTVTNNSAVEGGGIYSFGDNMISGHPRLKDVKIVNNYSSTYGGGIGLCESSPILINVTIAGNYSQDGGGLFGSFFVRPILINTIMWGNEPQEIYFYEPFTFGSLTVTSSDINGGLEAIAAPYELNVNWLEGNISENPLFVDPANSSYQLQQNSPCIDAGTAYFEYAGEVLIDLGEDEYWGESPDMGAFEFGMVDTDEFKTEEIKCVISNYPNPFNPETTIAFNVPQAGKVELSVYNVKGQKVRTLTNAEYAAGEHEVVWQGIDNAGRQVSSGVYFFRLDIEGQSPLLRKSVLMK